MTQSLDEAPFRGEITRLLKYLERRGLTETEAIAVMAATMESLMPPEMLRLFLAGWQKKRQSPIKAPSA